MLSGSNSGQFMLKWMVRIIQEAVVCVGGLSVHLNFKAPSFLRGDGTAHECQFVAM